MRSEINWFQSYIQISIFYIFRQVFLMIMKKFKQQHSKRPENWFFIEHLACFKFITFEYSDDLQHAKNFNLVICVEKECFVIKRITLQKANEIIDKLKSNCATVLNVGNHLSNEKMIKKRNNNLIEIKSFCSTPEVSKEMMNNY